MSTRRRSRARAEIPQQEKTVATQTAGKAPGKPPAPTRPVAPRAESGDTVTVACRLPQGIHFDIVRHGEVRQRVTLKGSNSPGPVAGFGITENVPREFFEKWLAEHQDLAAVRNGLIFAHARRASVEDQAIERTELKSGLDPMDPKKPGKDLAPLSKE
jgi:hypothetical protein